MPPPKRNSAAGQIAFVAISIIVGIVLLPTLPFWIVFCTAGWLISMALFGVAVAGVGVASLFSRTASKSPALVPSNPRVLLYRWRAICREAGETPYTVAAVARSAEEAAQIIDANIADTAALRITNPVRAE